MKHGALLHLGLIDYAEALSLQRTLVAQRQADEILDTLILCEHPPVLTVGRKLAARDNIIDPSLPIHEIERGGDVTYHGPGQLVGYPILKLGEHERDLHAYLRALEEALIRACADFGIEARRNPGLTGVWIGDRKVASLGIAVRRWVTLHGFALNVNTDLSRFHTIHPCGLDAHVMTSLGLTIPQVSPSVVKHLGEVLGRRFSPREP